VIPPRRRTHRWPFPNKEASPYRAVQLAALRACINDPNLAPDGFNDVLRAVWSSFLYRTIPTGEEFTEATEGLYGLLRDAAMPDSAAVREDVVEETERQHALLSAKRGLDALCDEARAAGVLLE
jgi:hypothetical protein